jgi:hypothetical protein
MFEADFMEVFDAFLNQLLQWATSKNSTVAASAGAATARLFRTLHDSRKELEQNETFRKTNKTLRQIKTNLRATPAGRFVDDEVWKAARERHWGQVYACFPAEDQKDIRKVSRWEEYRRVYSKLEDFGPETAQDWFDEIVWPRLQPRQDEFLAEPAIINSQTYKSAVKNKRRAYLSDFRKQFWQATQALAKRPKGYIRGVHRPRW